jgi:hypothetical protein
MEEAGAQREAAALRSARHRLEAILAPFLGGTLAERGLPAAMPDEDLINALSQYLELEPIEKQALLERDGPLARCTALVELIEMKTLTERSPRDSNVH